MPVLRAVVAAAVAVGAALGLGGSSAAARTSPHPRPSAPANDEAPAAGPGLTASDLSWRLTPTGSAARLRGLSVVSGSVAWVSGTGGTVLRTTDSGSTWASIGPADARALPIGDIEASSRDHAVALSNGSGADARIYVTDDGGKSWTESFRNDDDRAFYDCMAFSSPLRGLALSDPVDGAFRLLETKDGGHHWALVTPDGMPAALPNEFAFAASGACLTVGQGESTYLGTGGQSPARVLTSRNLGHNWSVAEVPVAGAPSAGVLSVQFRDRGVGVVVGGDYGNAQSAVGTAAWTTDGSTWHPSSPTPSGYRSGAAWLPMHHTVAVAVGPSGSDVTLDEGHGWTPFDTGSFDSVGCSPDGACWASGEQGRVARLVVGQR